MDYLVRTSRAERGAPLVLGLILALKAAVSPALQTFARTLNTDHDQAGRPTAESELTVSVTVYNYAPLSRGTLLKSEAETQRIFGKTGVKVGWRNCAVFGRLLDCSPEDHSFPAASMLLNVVPGSMAKQLASNDIDGGFATECPEAKTECEAYIFFDCAVDLVRAGCLQALGRVGCGDASLYQILGAMAAHELGHLLLGIHAHSRLGIMRPQWIARDFKDIAQGRLTFTPDQAKQLQTELHERMALQKHRASVLQIGISPLAACASQTFNRKQAVESTQPNIVVWLYNYAHAPDRIVVAAQNDIDRIFASTGITLSWVGCPTSAKEVLANPVCQDAMLPTELALTILPAAVSVSSKGTNSNTRSGIAQLFSDGQFGHYAYVFYDHVEEVASRGPVSAGELLGHVAAHELGHLLLRSNGHSLSGLMCGRWDLTHLQRAAWGQLRFTPAEAERIRTEVLARHRAGRPGKVWPGEKPNFTCDNSTP